MENILKIIYDKSKSNKIMTINDIDNILCMIIDNYKLQEYILNMSVQQIGSNKLASYSNSNKKLIIYSNVIDIMINSIEENLIINSDFEKSMYKNLSLLQIILHEIEHAIQEKNFYLQNNLETFILRISNSVRDNERLYYLNPEERFAEIKSYKEIIIMLDNIKTKFENLFNLLQTDQLERQLRGYRYCKPIVDAPLIAYFKQANKESLLSAFEWYSSNYEESLNCVISRFNLNERLFYGFPISVIEYAESLNCLVQQEKKYFKNKINII